jgi:signal transduction histidine kinase
MSHAGYGIEARNQIVERIRQVIVEDVHPLSRELVSKASKIQSSMKVQERQTKPRIVWPTTVMVRDATRVFALALIGLANVFVLFQAYAGGTWGLSASAAWLASMGFLALLKLLIPQNWRAPFYLGALFIAGLTLIGITPYILVTQLLAPSVAQLGALKFSGPAIAPIISVSLAYASAIAQDRARYEFALDNANAQLAREIILVEQQLWIARRAWAYLIHGNVQASLTAAILQLNRPAAQSTDRDAALASVQHAIEALKSPADLRIDLRTALDEIATTWTGTCDVKFDFAPDLLEEFGSSDSVSLCLNEIFKEAVSNAIRHGAATEVTCSVLKDADGQLHVRVINNGSPLISSRRSSMGTQLFDELCTKWTLSSDVSSGKTTLEAWVPTS